MNINQKTGAKIKELRISKSIDANSLSIDSGIDKSTLSKLENGKMNINLVHIEKISKALKLPIQELLPTASSMQINQDGSSNNLLNCSQIEINNTDPTVKEMFALLLAKLERA